MSRCTQFRRYHDVIRYQAKGGVCTVCRRCGETNPEPEPSKRAVHFQVGGEWLRCGVSSKRHISRTPDIGSVTCLSCLAYARSDA